MPVSRKTKDERELDADWRRLVKAYATADVTFTYELAKRHVKRWPRNGDALVILVSCLTILQRGDEAKSLIEKALAGAPPGIKRWLEQVMADLYEQRGDFKTAERWYRRAIRDSPSPNPESYVFLGSVLTKMDRFAEAKQAHRHAIALCRMTGRPKHADESSYKLALLYRAEGKYKRALYYVEQAIKLDPQYSAAKTLRHDLVKTLKFLGKKR